MTQLLEFLKAVGPDVESCAFSDAEVRDFRTSLKEYFEGIPNHELAGLACNAQIEKLTKIHCFKVSVAVFVERRRFQRDLTPYKGWKIPPLKRDETNTSVWDMKWVPPEEPCEVSEKKIIADSQELFDCSVCNHRGYEDCQACSSSGRIGCPKCAATGAQLCGHCVGSGIQKRQRQVQKFKKCTGCTATAVWNVVAVLDNNPYTRAHVCRTCRGTGQEPYVEIEEYEEACPACRGRRKVRCTDCDGRKVLQCDHCEGKGRTTCSCCKGQKAVVSFIELHRDFEKQEWDAECVGDTVNEILKKGHTSPFSVGQTKRHSWAGADPADLVEQLKSASTELSAVGQVLCDKMICLLQEQLKNTVEPERKTAWRMILQDTTANVVTYSLSSRKYRCIWDGTEDDRRRALRVFAHPSIVSAWCRSQLNGIRKTARHAGVREAAIDFQRLNQMATVDAACRQAMESGKQDDELKVVAEASKRVVVNQAQLVMFGTALLLYGGGVILYLGLSDKVPAVGILVAATVVSVFGWKGLRR